MRAAGAGHLNEPQAGDQPGVFSGMLEKRRLVRTAPFSIESGKTQFRSGLDTRLVPLPGSPVGPR
jgi:hypothetical protein